MVKNLITEKYSQNLEIFGEKHSPNHLELKYENRFEKGVEINSKTLFEEKSMFLKNQKFPDPKHPTQKWNISWKISYPCLDKFKYEISSKMELRSTF